ncbi:MAG: cytidylate kinase-like family protein [Lachnospiraceae bacterium]|nr:cytidylate kinase-like family protein [Lachnospiraceae bacterium]
MEKQLILSIGREFGSGGHEVAELIASKLGIQLIDDRLLYDLADENRIPYEDAKKYDEKPKNLFFSKTVAGYSSAVEENLAKLQFKYLKKIADKGQSFVVVGRCSEYVLREYPGMISAFILGDRDTKTARVVKKYQLSEHEAHKLMKKKDLTRKSYHNYYCDGKWGDSRNYDLCINSSQIGVEGTVEVLLKFIEQRQSKED